MTMDGRPSNDVVGDRVARAPSVARDSTLRFAAEVVWAACALVTGIIVARSLGPDGKGTAALLGYLVAIVGPLSALGLGDAGAALVRQGRVSLREAAASSMTAVALSSTVGALLLVGLAVAQFHGDGLYRKLDGSILIAALTIPVVAGAQVMTLLAESQRRLGTTSIARIVVGVTTAAATAIFIHAIPLGVAGVLLAGAIGFTAGAGVLALRLFHMGALQRPAFDVAYLRSAVRIGVPIQLSLVLVGLSARADMFVVQWFGGSSETGLYSVAITLSQLVLFVPVAIASASYAVIAGMSDAEFGPFVDRLVRGVLLVSIMVGVGIGVASPLLIPIGFGHGFRPAIETTAFLIPSAVFGAQQWMLCRALAARARGGLSLRSYAATTAVMLVADLALVPSYGRAGAAMAATLGNGAGLLVALHGYGQINPAPRMLRRTFLTGRDDVRLALMPFDPRSRRASRDGSA